MFESVTFGEQNKSGEINIGQIVEALIFFKNTKILVNRITLPKLVEYFDFDMKWMDKVKPKETKVLTFYQDPDLCF